MRKILLIILAILIHQTSNAQLNKIGNNEFAKIKFQGKSISEIAKTNGEKNKVDALFGSFFSEKNYSLPVLGREYWNDDLFIRFENDSGQGSNYSLAYVKVKNSNIEVEVNGVIYKIGDDISKFNNFNMIQSLHSKMVAIVDARTSSASLSFNFDLKTNKATNIELNFY